MCKPHYSQNQNSHCHQGSRMGIIIKSRIKAKLTEIKGGMSANALPFIFTVLIIVIALKNIKIC